MARVKRWVVNVAAVCSVLPSVAVSVLWCRSYRNPDQFGYGRVTGPATVTLYGVQCESGIGFFTSVSVPTGAGGGSYVGLY